MKYALFCLAALLQLPISAAIEPLAKEPADASTSSGTATIHDTFDRRKANRVHIYFVQKINGKRVSNASKDTARATGFSNSTDALGHSREVPAEKVTLSLAANYGGFKELTGELDFVPVAGESYLVKGQFEKEYSSLWLTDLNGKVVTELIERYAADYPHLERSRAAILNAHLERKSSSRLARFAQISSGESDALVQERFGPPDAIEEIPGNIFAERPPRTKYTYEGLGTILFSQKQKKGWLRKEAKGLFVERVTPEFSSSAATDGEPIDLAEAKHLLATDNSTTLRKIAQHYHKTNVRDPEVMDLLAARLARDYRTDNVMLLDALAWFCNTLGASENGRYKPLLTQVAANAKRKKLRRFAKKAATALPEPTGETFPFNALADAG